jgi:hypothetical protein
VGPTSHIWTGFIDPDTKLATYSIELARLRVYSEENPLGINDEKSNITFGGANDADYLGKANMSISALTLNYTYALNNFSFGRVYTENGADSSQYFYQLEHYFPAVFATNFKGLGLPANIYSDFVSLFTYITQDEASCENTLNGICTLPAPCENYTAYEEFAFLMNFTGAEDGNYMRIPLASFAENVKVSGGNTTCNVYVTYLDPLAAQSTSIILGGMFFQEFFGVFTNDYNDIYGDILQTARLYVGRNGKLNAYIGNETLPIGENPFIPHPPDPETTGISVAWIIVLSLLCAVLLGFLGYALYKWKVAQHNQTQRPLTYAEDSATQQRLVNNSDQITVPVPEK